MSHFRSSSQPPKDTPRKPEWPEGTFIRDPRPHKDLIELISLYPNKALYHILNLERRKSQLDKFIADRDAAIPKVFDEIFEAIATDVMKENQQALEKGRLIGYQKVLDTVRIVRGFNVPC